MNVTIIYESLNIDSLAAIAAASYRNVDIYEQTDKKGVSICDSIKSRNAIIFFLLNVDPLKEANNADILWYEKYIKPILYKYYRSYNAKIDDLIQIMAINRILNLIDRIFGSSLERKVKPLELVLWADLYIIFVGNLSKQVIKPSGLLTWFNEFNKIEPMQKAINLVFKDFERNRHAIMKNVPINSINITEIEMELFEFNRDEDTLKIYLERRNGLSNSSLFDEQYYKDDLHYNFVKNNIGSLSRCFKFFDYGVKELERNNELSILNYRNLVNRFDKTDKFDFLFGYKSVAAPFVFSKPKLPMKNKRNILLTSALPYVNNVPHLGNLIGSTLSADVFSRYCRLRGWNCLYVCGTDEYGTTTEVKAAEEKTTPKEICDHYHAIHADVYKWFNIDFDVFGRTTMEEHTKIVTEVFESINKHGFILEDEVTQLYCELCDKFLADRLVEGICPFCGFDDARGDQCDKCGKLINTVELKSPRCKLCSNSPVFKTSKHLFLDLQKIQAKLESYLKESMNAEDCVWSINAKSITNSWLKEGLKPRCITRDLKWGVPVPLDEFKGKVFYVWFDAVLGYLSITAHYTEHWKQWWLKQDGGGEVELYQFMAKDNVPFHSVILPANLIATGEPFNLIKQLASTEYLNYENTKFSKSRGLGVFGNDAKLSGIPADLWRFYLIASRPESQDSSFSWDEFATRINSELLNNLGNFINRALSFVVKFYGGLVPDFHESFVPGEQQEHGGEQGEQAADYWGEQAADYWGEQGGQAAEHMQFVSDVSSLIKSYVEQMEQIKLRDSVAIVLKISGLGNAYIQKHKPWVNVKSEEKEVQKEAATVIGVAANLAALLGVLLSPIMPETGQKILLQCNAPENSNQIVDDCRFRAFLQPNHQIGNVVALFQKMEPKFFSLMKQKFSSPQQ